MIDKKLEKQAEKVEDQYSTTQITIAIDKYFAEYQKVFGDAPPDKGYYISSSYYLLALRKAIDTNNKLSYTDFEANPEAGVDY